MIKLYDRIKEISYTNGTGNIHLSGPVSGFSSFSSSYSNNDALFYAITDGTNYEIGSGLYLSSTNQIKRFPFKTTNSNQLVNFTEGLKEIYVTYPATNSVFNTSGTQPIPNNSGLAIWNSSNSLSYSDKIVFDSANSRLGINHSQPSGSIHVGGLSPNSQIIVSGIHIGNSGIYFPSGNNGVSSYSGGRQLVHFEPNQLNINSSLVFDLSGIVNQNILLKKQSANTVFAGPSGGCVPPCNPDYPTFRSLVKDDLPEEISNWTVGDEESSTFLTINLPQGLPDVVYRDINAISVNADDGIFAVNGLGEIKFATIGYSQVDNLDSTMTSVSGSLNNRIVSASGALNNRITSVSGYLDTRISSVASSVSAINNNVFNARLSLSANNSTIDGSGTVLYLTPHNGSTLSLYNGSSWQTIQTSSRTVANFSSLTPNTIYDVFGFLSGGNISFELVAWNMHDPSYPNPEEPLISPWNSYRNVALGKINGVYCKSGNSTRRYIGTIKTGSTAFIDNESNRLICNFYNKIQKNIRSDVQPINDEPYFTFSWVYPTSLIRKIPYIPPVSVVNGLDSHIDLKVVLEVILPYSRSEYTLGIIRNPEIDNIIEEIDNDATFDYYEAVVLSNTSGLVTTDTVGSDYQDLVAKTISASIYCKPVGYENYTAIEKSRLGSPVVYGNRVVGTYGIMGTYEC